MLGIVWLLALLGAIAAWIIAGIKCSTAGGYNGRKFFFIQLGLCIGVLLLALVIFVIPAVKSCSGFLCGLLPVLIFAGAGALGLLIWPLIILAVVKSKFQAYGTNAKIEQEIIDNFENDILE
ncbi:MAG: hypothetical protein ACI857_001474 [Arenicella sp.]|jgi:hypothetical protein